MRSPLFHTIVVLGAALTSGAAAGCSESHDLDAAVADARAPMADAGSPRDAGSSMDAGSPIDAGSPADADVDTGIVLIL